MFFFRKEILIIIVAFLSACSASKDFFIQKELNGNKLKHGYWIEYADSSYEITKYKNGKKHGEYLSFYPDGILKISGEYKNDIAWGKWYFYDEKGRVQKILGHKEGKSYVIEINNLLW